MATTSERTPRRRGEAERGFRAVAHRAMRSATGAERATEKAAGGAAFKLVARIGYVVRGVLYGTMGVVGLQMAVGQAVHGADQKGTLAIYAAAPVGRVILVLFAAALAAYSLWGFVRAVFDPLHRGRDAVGLVARAGFAWSGIAYAGLVFAMLQLLVGSGAVQEDSVQALVQGVLAAPLGVWAVGAAGVIAIGMGLGQFVDAWKATFRMDLKKSEMHKPEYQAALFFGRFGMVSRGVIFTISGWFIVQAALYHDATRAHNMGAAFDALLAGPLGHLLTAVVALGFVALALHSFACARYVRML